MCAERSAPACGETLKQSLSDAALWKGIALGQLLSLLTTGTGIASEMLASRYSVSIPTTQSFLNYTLLAALLVPLLWREKWGGVRRIVRDKWWKYGVLAVADVEANFLVVLAYRYTSLPSVMLLDCFSIPCVMVLSRLFLKQRYYVPQFVGVAVCLGGVVMLVVVDVLVDHSESSPNPLLGDMLCLGAAMLYAVSNVGQEKMVKDHSKLEYLAMLGAFGMLINGTQAAILEHHSWSTIVWSAPVVGYMLMFAICLFAMYCLVPVMLTMSGATFLNLSLLTSDVFAILAGVLLFDFEPSPLYFVAGALVVAGLIVYNIKTPAQRVAELKEQSTVQREEDEEEEAPDGPQFPTDGLALAVESDVDADGENVQHSLQVQDTKPLLAAREDAL